MGQVSEIQARLNNKFLQIVISSIKHLLCLLTSQNPLAMALLMICVLQMHSLQCDKNAALILSGA